MLIGDLGLIFAKREMEEEVAISTKQSVHNVESRMFGIYIPRDFF